MKIKAALFFISSYLFCVTNLSAQCDDLITSRFDRFEQSTTYTYSLVLHNSTSTLKIDLSSASSNPGYYSLSASTYYGQIDFKDTLVASEAYKSMVTIGKGAYLQLLFEDNSSEKLYRPQNMDMEGPFFTSFWQEPFDQYSRLKFRILQKMQSKKIVAIRFYTTRGTFDYDLTSVLSGTFLRAINCVFK